jgi:hypothetical protein
LVRFSFLVRLRSYPAREAEGSLWMLAWRSFFPQHKGELSMRGHRLILYFGLEGSAFNNIDQPVPLTKVGSELGKAMGARPFSYRFFRTSC